jgi:hypothetical protein
MFHTFLMNRNLWFRLVKFDYPFSSFLSALTQHVTIWLICFFFFDQLKALTISRWVLIYQFSFIFMNILHWIDSFVWRIDLLLLFISRHHILLKSMFIGFMDCKIRHDFIDCWILSGFLLAQILISIIKNQNTTSIIGLITNKALFSTSSSFVIRCHDSNSISFILSQQLAIVICILKSVA